MGGKPQKPKIQAYVEQRWFDEFGTYCTTYNLNQSRALEKILAEFFGGSSTPTLPPDGVTAVTTSALIDSLRAELTDLKQELEQRLRLVESRWSLESAAPLNGLTTDSADESVVGLAESADESVNGLANSVDGLATESATPPTESAIPLDRLATESAAVESVYRLANILTIESSAIALAESAANPSNESAGEEAIAADTLGGIPESTAPSSELAEVVEVSTALVTSTPISEPVAADNIVPENPEAPTTLAIKSGKQPTVEVRQILEKKLAPGQTVNKPELVALIGKTPESVRLRVKNATLHEWGIRRVPGSKPEMFELM